MHICARSFRECVGHFTSLVHLTVIYRSYIRLNATYSVSYSNAMEPAKEKEIRSCIKTRCALSVPGKQILKEVNHVYGVSS